MHAHLGLGKVYPYQIPKNSDNFRLNQIYTLKLRIIKLKVPVKNCKTLHYQET